ncbi:MAG: hypothetical protein ABI624_00555 [Casimicrobiaceae bacterium]
MTPAWHLRIRQAAALLLLALALDARPQDTRALQVREAQRTDERTLAYFAQFRAALTARFGADPLLSMLVFDEQEGQALVHKSAGGPPEHVIFQTGKWIGTDGRELLPWAPAADPAIARFALSGVSETFVRDKFRAYRAPPAKAADHLGPVKVGYFGDPFNRLVAQVQVASMATFAFSVIAFDLRTGQALDIDAAIADTRARRLRQVR